MRYGHCCRDDCGAGCASGTAETKGETGGGKRVRLACGGKRWAGNRGTCDRARSYWDGAIAPKGIFAMTVRDDLAASHVPPIDWAELLVSGILIMMITAAVLVFIR